MLFLYPSPLENIKFLYKKSNIKRGKPRSQEFKEKQRQNSIKQFSDPRQREKHRIAAKNVYVNSEVKIKISKFNIERWKDREWREKFCKINLGRKHSSKTKEKCSKAKLGKKQSKEHTEKIRQKNLGKKRSYETKEKLKLAKLHLFSALDHLLKDKYCPLWTHRLRESVRIRDSYTCQLCGIIQEEHKSKTGKKLSVHHIHYDKKNCYPDCITLCDSCNVKANFNRKYYESLFMNILNKRELLFWTKSKNEQKI